MKNFWLFVCIFFTGCSDFIPMLKTDTSENTAGAQLVVTHASKGGSSYLVHQLRQLLKCTLTDLRLDNRYKIHVQIHDEIGSLSYAADATSTRSMAKLTALLTISKMGQTVYETKISVLTSYSQNANDEFVNQSAQSGARERLLKNLSIDLGRELNKFAYEQK